MKTFKVRWRGADGRYCYKEFTFPSDDAALCVGLDDKGNELYDGDIFDNTHRNELGVYDGSPMSVELRLGFYDGRGASYYYKVPNYKWFF